MKTSTKEVVNVDKRSHDGSTLTSMMNRRIQFPFESSVSKKNSAYKKIRSVFNGIPRTVRVHHPPEFLVVLVEDSEREAETRVSSPSWCEIQLRWKRLMILNWRCQDKMAARHIL